MDEVENAPLAPADSLALRHWIHWNACAALLAAAACLLVQHTAPAVGTALFSVGWALASVLPGQLGKANTLTAARLLLLAAVLAFAPGAGLWVASTAFLVYVLDGVDGWLARRHGEASAFGAQLDMECDAHAVLLLSLHLVLVRGFGVWVLICGVLRPVYVAARWVFGPGQVRERRSSWGRWVYSLVIVSLALGCVADWEWLARPLLAAAAALLLLSFAPDFRALGRRGQ
jgi:phosphatidylglycerophosphate synthase